MSGQFQRSRGHGRISKPCNDRGRRGVTLLFVISLIVLFLLMGATFVAISGNFMRTSKGRSVLEFKGDSSRTIVSRALFELLRGSANPNSKLHEQSILGDMYANGFERTVVSATPEANGQLIRLLVNEIAADPDFHTVGAFGGRVLTFVDGPAKGISCRVFHYDVQYDAAGTPSGHSYIVAPEWTNGLNPFANLANLANTKFRVNGAAFVKLNATDMNESYDAVDDENRFLASVDISTGTPNIVASFDHGPPPTLRAFSTSTGLQVDTDSDATRDSIWIDLGFPIQSDKTGRQYKTLVAYHVVDLDGKFNLNLHGSGDDARGRLTANAPLLGAPGVVSRGQGYGPSEVDLGLLFPPPGGYPATPVNYNQEYFNLLGDPSSTYYGRFGPAGPTGIYAPGISEVQDAWSQYKLFGYPIAGIGNLFGSRMDANGRYGWGFPNVVSSSGAGDLPYAMPGIDATPLADELTDSPFETDVSDYPYSGPSENPLVAGGSTRPDHLYSPKELERVYRAFDFDSKFLARRLVDLAPSLDASLPGSNPNIRFRVSTGGWDVPVPPSNLAKALYNFVVPTSRAQIANLLPPEALQGLKMDLNRPFGNGVDDNGNGVIDEYFMPGNGEVNSENVPYPAPINSVTIDLNRDGVATQDNPLFARVTFAKQLYVMAATYLRSKGSAGDFDGDMNISPGPDMQWGVAGVDDDSNATIDDASEAGWPGSDDIVTGTVADDADDQKTLAQWCANVVDFRDSDDIITAFEYDTNPFNGWECNGVLTSDALGNYVPDGPDTRVVWGCERPELLLTESNIFHDRRLEDLPEGGSGIPDDDLDTRLRPEPGAFVELYAPWVAGNDVSYPGELYNGSQVDLARTTPLGNPVWRIAVAGPDSNDGEYVDAGFSPGAFDDNRNRDPDDRFNPGANPATINRVVYFVPYSGAPFLGDGGAEAFYASVGGPKLLPVGQFAVVGSSGNVTTGGGYTTTLGRRLLDSAGNPVIEGDPAVLADTRSITLDTVNNVVRIRDFHESSGTMITLARPALVIPAEAIVPNPLGLPGPLPPRPFNVSDPTGGYPLVDSTAVPAVPTVDGWIYTTPFDEPLDKALLGPSYKYNCVKDNKTTPTFCVFHLQRLANPMTDWDPVLNPYITVDTLSANLTAFNGISNADDPQVSASVEEMVRDLASMERGRNRKYPPAADFYPAAANVFRHRELWAQDGLDTGPVRRRGFLYRTLGPGINEVNSAGQNGWHLAYEPATIPADPDEHVFNSTMFETLGTFNDAWFDHWQGVGPVPPWVATNETPTNPPARDGDGVTLAVDAPPAPLGLDATKPFSWLSWNNRPYVSQFELMLVPKTSSFALLRDFSALASNNPYDESIHGFSHLMNFFVGQWSNGGSPVKNYFGGLLDYVEVPSRYIGTERYFVPSPAAGSASPFGDLAAPFNFASRYRVPGKVNINTVFDPALWQGIMGEYAYALPAPAGPYMDYASMSTSRNTQIFRENSAYDPMGNPQGILRKGTGTDGLFVYDPPSMQESHNNSDRNAYFRYDPIQRLGNLITTRSNVFAVWITVGYFEVDQNGNLIDLANPDNCEVGRENGQITRHRGFFIIDRSVPVAFEEGVDHNVSRAIMVESYIE